jgi:GNAT superfamily N-acetyltransferase
LNAVDPVTTREASVDDAALLHTMIARMAASTPAQIRFCSSVENYATALAGEDPALRAFIAQRADSVVGVVTFFKTFSTWYGKTGIYVQDLYVAEEARGAGVGRILMATASRWGIRQGATHLKLAVDTDNSNAEAFYQNLGMAHRDDEKVYMIEGPGFAELAALR